MRKSEYLPLAVDLNACVATVGVAVLFGDAYVLLSAYTAWATITLFFSDADVFARVAVVSTGRALLGVSITLTFPSSAFNRNSFVSLDLGGL